MTAAKGTPRIEVQLAADLLVDADPHLFQRVLANLLRNALLHANASVQISAVREPGGVRVSVADDGLGVPSEDRLRIFEPFARVDPSRNRDTGGVGLGLAIVQAIMRTHGGRAFVEDAATGGAMFVTIWPDTTSLEVGTTS